VTSPSTPSFLAIDPVELEEIAANLAIVREKIELSVDKRKVDRSVPVKLIGVSKYQPRSKLFAAFTAGLRDFGENYAQEFREKYEQWMNHDPENPPNWHFIGTLQSNKVKIVCGQACIHTVDRKSLLAKLDARAAQLGIVQSVLVEVNMGEKQKSGVAISELPQMLDLFQSAPNMRCIGLMTMPPIGSAEQSRKYFRKLRELRDTQREIHRRHVDLEHLSMGMSRDFEVAIEEGATMIRVGTAIFGSRTE